MAQPVPSKEAPPNYASADPANDGPSIEDMNAGFAHLDISESAPEFPSANHCLAHLKLLNAFHALKEDVGYTDGIFGIWDSGIEAHSVEGIERDKALSKAREKRWLLFIARAVERFEEWWVNVLCRREDGRRLEGKEMHAGNAMFTEFMYKGTIQKWTTTMLPPLGMYAHPLLDATALTNIDVLMVWHAFTLNPRSYLEDCIRFNLKNLWATGFPWHAINAAIDTSFNYDIPDSGKAEFVAQTGHNWSNSDDSLKKKLHCPRCTHQLEIPWTTCCDDKLPTLRE